MLHHQHVEKEPGEQRSGFFFALIPDTFSERTNQFQRQQVRNGGTHANRNNPSNHLGHSADRGVARVALCGGLGTSAGRYFGCHPDRSFDPCSYGQDLNYSRWLSGQDSKYRRSAD